MRGHLKNINGDPASPINSRLCGLFFCVSVDPLTGHPVPISAYGIQRLLVLSRHMLSPGNYIPNLYFADFYCHDKRHHVTIVMTRTGTDADNFCQEKLILLDNQQNDFMCIGADGITWVTTVIWVEVFYTENINIPELQHKNLCYFTLTPSYNWNIPRQGKSKNVNCKVCNLY